MFENIIAQDAASQLCADVRARRLAPAILFHGPAASGKGSTALELGRALSCEKDAAWNCACPACARHRHIIHSDLLCMGKRAFGAEIAAGRAAFLREPFAPSTPILFIRSVRKLMARFSPVLWEDDAKIKKFRPALETMEETLAEFELLSSCASDPALAADLDVARAGKFSEVLLKNAQMLESEGIGDLIPIGQIRNASYWTRLAPAGKRKTLLIENAGHMREETKNSLLKLLEEPPELVTIILTAERRQLIIPTQLSRLRQYRFLKRDREKEFEVIRRVFRDSGSHEGMSGLGAYLDSFLPVSNEGLQPLAAFLIASLARCAVIAQKKSGASVIPDELNALGSYCAPIAEEAGFKKVQRTEEACSVILEKSSGFESVSFSHFLKTTLDMFSRAMREAGVKSRSVYYNDIWIKYTGEADSAVSVYNQNPASALESLLFRLKTAMCAV